MDEPNDQYEIIGGVLHETPIDETSVLIDSTNFIRAKALADALISAKTSDGVLRHIVNLDKYIVNFMNSPLVDFLYKHIVARRCYKMTEVFKQAVVLGNLSIVRYLYSRNVKFDMQKDCLEVACRHGHLPVVKYFIGNNMTHTLLEIAIKFGHLELVEFLDERIADKPHDVSKSIRTCSDVNIIKYLHSKGYRFDDIHYILNNFIKCAELECLKYLVETLVENLNMNYLIRQACKMEQLAAVKYLIEKIDLAEFEPRDPLILSIIDNHIEIVKYILTRNISVASKQRALLDACYKSSLEMIQVFLLDGVDINTPAFPGCSCLKNAITGKNTRIFKYLIDNGCVIDDSVIEDIVYYGYLSILKYMHSIGIDLHAGNDRALQVACFSPADNAIDIIKYLIGIGADLQSINKAYEYYLAKTRAYLIELGVELN